MTVYSYSETLETLGRNVITSAHPHLLDVRVEFVFREKHVESKGREVWGRARKVTGLPAYLATFGRGGTILAALDVHAGGETGEEPEPFFVIEIAEDIWNALTGKQRIALLDHELSHCRISVKGDGLEIAGHDIEEFEGTIRRHGLWKDDVARFAKVAADHIDEHQLRLLPDPDDVDDDESPAAEEQ